MTVAGEAEVERERRQVVGVRQLDQRARETKLHDVALQRYALEAAEHIGEVGRRRADRPGDVDESNGMRGLRVEELTRATNEATRPARRREPRLVQLQRRAEKREHVFIRPQRVEAVVWHAAVEETCAHGLKRRCGPAAARPEQRMLPWLEPCRFGELGQYLTSTA